MYGRHRSDLGYLSGLLPILPYYGLGRSFDRHAAVAADLGVDARIIVAFLSILTLNAIDFGEFDSRLGLTFLE